MKELIGKKIIAIILDRKIHSLKFDKYLSQFNLNINADLGFLVEDVDKKMSAIYYSLYGDCCSNPYIESFDNMDWLLDQIVISSEEFFLYQENDGNYGDVIDYHRYEISSNKGTASIEFRVAHNGYYGGNIQFNNEQNF